jgi:chromosome segregation ATPase
MYRKILSWAFLILGTLVLILSIAGIAAIWFYRVPARDQAISRLKAVDSEMTQAELALDNGKAELERTLRIVDAAEKSLAALKSQLTEAKILTDKANGTLNSNILPGLQSTRDKINQLRGTLQSLRDSLKQLNSVPFLNLNIPGDQFLADLIDSVDTLDQQIAAVVKLTEQASTFAGDASYLMGGDLSDTRQRVQTLLNTINEYDTKVKGWHTELRHVMDSVPRWINEAAIGLTVFLLWLGISQFGLILHGLALREGADILAPLKRALRKDEVPEYVD